MTCFQNIHNTLFYVLALSVILTSSCIASSVDVTLPVDTGFEEGIEGMNAYKGKISVTSEKANAHTGERALEWKYSIKKKSYRFIARSNLDSSQFKGTTGISVWLKSDKEGPLLLQVIEKDNSCYQYINNALPITKQWKKFSIPFNMFEKDPDVNDENNRLDIDQIKEIWLVDVSGYYYPHLVGPRTVWVDDLKLETIPSSPSLPKQVSALDAREGLEVLPSGPARTSHNLKSDPYVMKDGGIYKMWFGANEKGKYQQVWYATSLDGISWKMHTEPVVRVGKKGEWDAGDIETPTVLKVDNVYHMWYCGRSVSEESETWSADSAYRIGHAASKDGIIWVKDPGNPVIGLGNRKENEWNWATSAEPSVIYEDGLYKMWYVGVNVLEGKAHLHVGYATSTNGSTWTNYQENPVIASRPSRESIDYNGYFSPFVIKDGKRYIILYVTDSWNSMPVGPVRYATSTDGINWIARSDGIVSKGDAMSWMSTGIFSPSAIIEDGKLNIWFTGFRITTNFFFGIGYTRLDMGVLK